MKAWASARTFVAEVNDDRLLGLAAEAAFFAVLSLFPGLLIAASLFGLLDVVLGADLAARAENSVISALDRVLTDEASSAVSSVERLGCPGSGGVRFLEPLGHDDLVPGFELYRREPAQGAVPTLSVVPDLEVLEDGLHQFYAGASSASQSSAARLERFDDCAVVAVADACT